MTQKTIVFCLALAFALCAGVTANAQPNPNYQASFLGAPGPITVSGTFDCTTTLDSAAGDVIAGWSWGVCTDPALLTVDGAVNGSTTLTINNGNPPDFSTFNFFAGGWTYGVVISFAGLATLAPGSGYQLEVATYTVVGMADETGDICYCNTLGSPPTAVVVVVFGQSVNPVTTCKNYVIMGLPDPFIFLGNDTTAGGPFTQNLQINENPGNDQDRITQGFSMDIGHDPAVLTATSIDPAGVVADLNGGTGPNFIGPTILPDGITVGIVYDFTGMETIIFQQPEDVIAVGYDTPGLPAPGDPPVNTMLQWTNTLGSPPVVNVVVVGGQSNQVEFDDIRVNLEGTPPEPFFIRADANNDSIVNIADGIWIINELFLGGPTSPCQEAADANDDDMNDSSDAVYIWTHQFLGGPPPPAPFPNCGQAGDVDCDGSSCP